jgi:hypothetical protein
MLEAGNEHDNTDKNDRVRHAHEDDGAMVRALNDGLLLPLLLVMMVNVRAALTVMATATA